MPPRLNKRQQRELEELEALGGPSHADVSSEEDIPVPKKAAPVFSNFLAAEEIESDNESEKGSVKPAKPRKKKKKKAPVPTKATVPATPPSAKNEKKALKKAKAKEKKAGDDELEQALAELSVKYPSLQKQPTTGTSTSTSSSTHTLSSLLAVSPAHLDPTAEMRKFFGAKVVQANKPTTSTSGAGPSTRRALAQRSHLTRPQPGWWSASQREGLSIRLLTEEGKPGVGGEDGEGEKEKWWTVEYSQRYKSMTKLFIQAVMSGHPDALWEVQRKLPWHADNLLQLAEVYRHREEYAQAVDFVDRALFAYERAFIGAFTFTSGTNRLDFARVENRPFFLALHRQIADLQRRGCTRTAFEFARLLYALDPRGDPHGALLHLEVLALKAGMGAWLVDLWGLFAARRRRRSRVAGVGGSGKDQEGKGKGEKGGMDPSVLPGWMYARALALRGVEGEGGSSNHEPSKDALAEAMRAFPSIVPLLADKIDVVLPAHIRARRECRIETEAGTLPPAEAALHALSHLYAQRSATLWKHPAHAAWFLATATLTFPPPPSSPPASSILPAFLPTSLLPSSSPPIPEPRQTLLRILRDEEGARYAVYRHITVLESAHRSLVGFIPGEVRAETGRGMACDPVPPPKPKVDGKGEGNGNGRVVTRYDEEYFAGVEVEDVWAGTTRGGRGGRQEAGGGRREEDMRILEGVIPDAGVRAQVLDVLAGFAAQFGVPAGGGLGEMVERMGVEAVEDLVAQVQGLAQGGGGAGGEMPGEMPGFGLEFGVDAEAEAEAEAEAGAGAGAGAEPPLAVGGEEAGVEREGEDESESETDEEDPSAVRRVLRTLLGRFWGGAGVDADDSSDDDERVGEGERERDLVDGDGVD